MVCSEHDLSNTIHVVEEKLINDNELGYCNKYINKNAAFKFTNYLFSVVYI